MLYIGRKDGWSPWNASKHVKSWGMLVEQLSQQHLERLEPSWVITRCIYRIVHCTETVQNTEPLVRPDKQSGGNTTFQPYPLELLVVFKIQDFRLLTLLVLGIQEVEATEYNGTITAGLCLPIEAGSNRDRFQSCRKVDGKDSRGSDEIYSNIYLYPCPFIDANIHRHPSALKTRTRFHIQDPSHPVTYSTIPYGIGAWKSWGSNVIKLRSPLPSSEYGHRHTKESHFARRGLVLVPRSTRQRSPHQ